MSKIAVVYWSATGNTEAMANSVAEGIKEVGKEVDLLDVETIDASALDGVDTFALGCPAMGDEVLEEDTMEPFVAAIEGSVSGKKVALFGSYDWGDGEWMRQWETRMKNAGAVLATGAGVIANNEPTDEDKEACKALGKALAAM